MKKKWKKEWEEWPPRYVALADLDDAKNRNKAAFRYFKEKYRDVLQWEHTEPQAILDLLSIVATENKKQGVMAIETFTRCSLEQMAALASKDLELCNSFVQIVSKANHALFDIMNKNPAMRVLVQVRDQFPALLYRHPQLRKRVEHFYFGDCELALHSPINNAGGFSFDTPETRIAYNLFPFISSRRMTDPTIPVFTRANSKIWWKLAKRYFLLAYGNDFPRHPEFERYWKKFDAKRWKDRKLSGYEKRDIVRKDILKAMERAFRSLAKKL